MRLIEALLSEEPSRPKAIFMAGPAGAGKSTMLKQLGLENFKVINVDDAYEELLKQEFGDDMDFSKMSPEQLSQAAKFMGTARKVTKEKEASAIQNLNNIVIDGTGAASKPLLKKKADLEAIGYDTFMFALYVSPMTSLKRNAARGRSLPTPAILSSWAGLAKNLEEYMTAFGNNIVVIDNDPEDADKTYDIETIKKMFPSPKGKPKTPEEQAKSDARKAELNQQIADLLSKESSTKRAQMAVGFDEAQSKVKQFVAS